MGGASGFDSNKSFIDKYLKPSGIKQSQSVAPNEVGGSVRQSTQGSIATGGGHQASKSLVRGGIQLLVGASGVGQSTQQWAASGNNLGGYAKRSQNVLSGDVDLSMTMDKTESQKQLNLP